MNKSDVLAKLEYFNMVHGVTLRAISALGDEDLDFRPRPSMRSPKELIFHIYTQEKILAGAVRLGRFTAESASRSNPEDKAVAAELKVLATVEDLIGPVESPFGAYPVWRYCEFGYDEHWHHRGQLYTYLRLLGKEPPMLYDY